MNCHAANRVASNHTCRSEQEALVSEKQRSTHRRDGSAHQGKWWTIASQKSNARCPRSQALLGNAVFDAPRRLPACPEAAEQPRRHSHAERGNEEPCANACIPFLTPNLFCRPRRMTRGFIGIEGHARASPEFRLKIGYFRPIFKRDSSRGDPLRGGFRARPAG